MNPLIDRQGDLRHIRTLLDEAAPKMDDPRERAIIATLAIVIAELEKLDRRVTAIQEQLAPF